MTRLLLVLGLLLAAGVAAALPPYAVNPLGTDAVANGKLLIVPGATRACFNVPLRTADPPAPADGDVWFVHTGIRHQGCVRMSGATRCWDATLTP